LHRASDHTCSCASTCRRRRDGVGAAAGIVMSPAIAAALKYAVDWLTSPLHEGGTRGTLEMRLDGTG
jgi:hypothetical protein